MIHPRFPALPIVTLRRVFCPALLSMVAIGSYADAAPPSLRLLRVNQDGQVATFEANSSKLVKLSADQGHANDRDTRFEAVGLPAEALEAVGQQPVDAAAAGELFAVFVASAAPRGPAARQPLLGSYRVEGNRLAFLPRFPLEPGVVYEARLHVPAEPRGAKPIMITALFEIPRRPMTATTRVEQVYPTSDVLPENQLKFYLHFSTPMSTGQAYQHVRLLDSAGKPIEGAFLEIGEELWDRRGQRFTLFFDPGRIKRGLKPREDLGPALEEGKRYTLLVDRAWQDANGNPLTSEFRKTFRVVGPDDTPPSEANWRIERPTTENGHVLTVDFREPLDHALLERVVWVEGVNATGQAERVEGRVEITRQETRWKFTPDKPLVAGVQYYLVAEKILEDRAGNSLGRKFEVDMFDRVDQRTTSPQARILIAGAAEK